MRRISFWHLAFGLSAAALAVAASACGDPFGQDATVENPVDTVVLYPLRDTPIRLPSAYNMLQPAGAQAVRTDTTSQFDFAFDIDTTGQAVVYPAGARRAALPRGCPRPPPGPARPALARRRNPAVAGLIDTALRLDAERR